MKKRVVFLCICTLLCRMMLCAQHAPEGLIAAFQKGDAAALGSYLGHNVELVVDKKHSQAEKQVAGKQLTAFFTANKVSRFQIIHQGRRDESGFIIGTLVTSNGNFRVNCFFKKSENQYVIHQIRIDKSNE